MRAPAASVIDVALALALIRRRPVGAGYMLTQPLHERPAKQPVEVNRVSAERP